MKFSSVAIFKTEALCRLPEQRSADVGILASVSVWSHVDLEVGDKVKVFGAFLQVQVLVCLATGP
jgi:hypothetical protein